MPKNLWSKEKFASPHQNSPQSIRRWRWQRITEYHWFEHCEYWLHQCWHEGFVNNASWTIASWPIASWPIDPNHCASNWLVNIKRYYLLFFGRKFSFLDLLIFATIGISFHFAGMTGILSTVSIHLFWKFTSGAPRNLGAPWSKILESFWADEPLN